MLPCGAKGPVDPTSWVRPPVKTYGRDLAKTDASFNTDVYCVVNNIFVTWCEELPFRDLSHLHLQFDYTPLSSCPVADAVVGVSADCRQLRIVTESPFSGAAWAATCPVLRAEALRSDARWLLSAERRLAREVRRPLVVGRAASSAGALLPCASAAALSAATASGRRLLVVRRWPAVEADTLLLERRTAVAPDPGGHTPRLATRCGDSPPTVWSIVGCREAEGVL